MANSTKSLNHRLVAAHGYSISHTSMNHPRNEWECIFRRSYEEISQIAGAAGKINESDHGWHTPQLFHSFPYKCWHGDYKYGVVSALSFIVM